MNILMTISGLTVQHRDIIGSVDIVALNRMNKFCGGYYFAQPKVLRGLCVVNLRLIYSCCGHSDGTKHFIQELNYTLFHEQLHEILYDETEGMTWKCTCQDGEPCKVCNLTVRALRYYHTTNGQQSHKERLNEMKLRERIIKHHVSMTKLVKRLMHK